ncbi:TolC family protein [Pelagicoccus sp. SDUM812002]|uniref:TolC family protein n=1 Tax=Pelagicoccus sp. SDUM812002 TaxID=3041266 RepID=UPI00280DD6EE|nr:TolC family protein [Pelagicoccus sp. SDUM812002]MDQ8185499.1 TolC family protein [Pelagicoccus sp. SDUM812002]
MKTRSTFISLATLAAFCTLSAKNEPILPQGAAELMQHGIAGPFITEALANSPALVVAENRYQAARASIDSSSMLPNPRVQITHFVESIQTRTGPQRQALSLQQPIPWLGSLRSKKEIAQSQAQALWHAYASLQFETVDQVTTAAIENAYLSKSITIAEQNLQLLERLESIAGDKIKSGGLLSDLLRIQLETEKQRDALARQRTLLLANSAHLEGIIGRSPSGNPLPIEWSAPMPLQTNPEQWIAAIRQNSPQIATLQALLASQESRERLARLANRPEFTLGINYVRTGDALNPEMADSGKDPWALMVGVSLPIWGKANNAIARQASFERDAVSAQIEELQFSLLAEGQAWIARLNDAQTRVQRYQEKLIPLAQQAHEVTESAYRSDQASVLDLIDTDRALLNLETEYWRAASDAWIARWKLTTLSGGLWLD